MIVKTERIDLIEWIASKKERLKELVHGFSCKR